MPRSKLFPQSMQPVLGRFLLNEVRRNGGWRVVQESSKQQDLHFSQQNLHLLQPTLPSRSAPTICQPAAPPEFSQFREAPCGPNYSPKYPEMSKIR
jgi:hypothetical protein